MTKPALRNRHAVWLPLTVLAGIALSAGWAVLMAPEPKPPAYQRLNLCEWIDRYEKTRLDPRGYGTPQREQEMASCRAAIRAIGTNALPFAMADINANGALWKYDNVRLVSHNIRTFLKLPFKDRLRRGINVLKVLGPIAEPCLPELIANAENNRLRSAEALMCVGPAALPALTNLLIHSSPPQTGALVNALTGAINEHQISKEGGITPEQAAMALPALIQVCRARQNADWWYAASGLGFVLQKPDVCIPLPVEGLADTNFRARDSCLFSLGQFGEAASSRAREVAALFNDSRARVRWDVCVTLSHFRSAGHVAVPVLVRGLKDPDDRVRMQAAFALGLFASHAQEAIPALQQSLRNSSPGVRASAAHALGLFGQRATNAVADLERLSSDTNAEVSAESIKSLRLICESGVQ